MNQFAVGQRRLDHNSSQQFVVGGTLVAFNAAAYFTERDTQYWTNRLRATKLWQVAAASSEDMRRARMFQLAKVRTLSRIASDLLTNTSSCALDSSSQIEGIARDSASISHSLPIPLDLRTSSRGVSKLDGRETNSLHHLWCQWCCVVVVADTEASTNVYEELYALPIKRVVLYTLDQHLQVSVALTPVECALV